MSNVPAHTHHPRGEWVKFALLAVVFLIVILGVALLRPFIFDRLVPAVLGEGVVVADEPQPAVQPAPDEETTDTAVEEESSATEAESAASSESEEAAQEEAAQEEAAQEEAAELPTAVATVAHTVSPGQTLTSIARAYGVSVQAIKDANNLTNPNVLRVGDVLLIPQP